MQSELLVTKLFLTDKDIYNKYSHYVINDYMKDNYPELFTINTLLSHYYEKYDSNIEDFESYFYASLPRIKDKEAETYKDIFETLKETAVNKELVIEILNKYKEKEQVNNIVLKGISYLEGNIEYNMMLSDIEALVKSKDVSVDYEFASLDLDHILQETIMSSGLRWRLRTMNQMLGSLRKGNFGFVFARPETGKTTFLASEISYMLDQCSHPVIWFNNEQTNEEVALRMYQAYFGVDKEELLAKKQHYASLFPVDKFRIFGGESGSVFKRDIENICKELQPSLIVFDQIDKLKGWKTHEQRLDMAYKEIYQWARELAKEYCPVIGVCQAGGTAEGKKWLTMDDVDSSKTAKQGEADWILGIGKTNEEGMGSIRHLHLSKNKLPGDQDSIPDDRHGRRDVLIVPEVARYADFLETSG